ncbi:hypothetical protein GOB93_06610 [Acetobacter musti]|uniref:Uncharacterized protein n=1 Tax=Acetobacter musti TaxID=864732 RepID=A0ABX0JM79_9PROT|nr:hypothetical protein [Acetobacter musti]NHN84317.1 hypothetical protein [Acetobacter musti]
MEMRNEKFIKNLIETADRQIQYKEYKTALILIIIAVAASSKKMFPHGTRSLDLSSTKSGSKRPLMPDNECFTRFLESRLGRLGDKPCNPVIQEDGTHNRLNDDGTRNPNLPAMWGPLATLIYKEIRCPIIHEGWIAADLECIDTLSDLSGLTSIQIKNGKIVLQRGLLSALRTTVIDAPCNGIEFGKEFWRLISSEGKTPHQMFNDGIHFINMLDKIGVVGYPGRAFILANFLEKIGPESNVLDDDALAAKFSTLLNNSNSAGLANPGPSFNSVTRNASKPEPWITSQYRLSDTGIRVARAILHDFSYVNISK